MLVSKAIQRGEIQARYRNDFVLLPMQEHRQGRQVYIHREKFQRFKDVFNRRSTHFGLNYLFRQIWSLKSSGFLGSLFHQSSPISRLLAFEGGTIRYAALNGNIYIEEISITGPLGADGKHPAGVYKVKRTGINPVRWEPEERNDKVEQLGYIKTKNLAVSGYSESLADAANYIPKFIEHGFGQGALRDTYSLFYSPTKSIVAGAYKSLIDDVGVKELQTAKKLSVLFEQLAQKQQELNLTVHGSGHYIFKSALKKVRNQNLQLPNVTVFYANATTNLSAVDYARRKAGMKLSGKSPLLNPASLQQHYLSGNVASKAEIEIRAKPGNAVATLVNLATSLPTSFSVSLGASLILGSQRPLERNVIENTGSAMQSGAKLVWDNVHKMMVRA